MDLLKEGKRKGNVAESESEGVYDHVWVLGRVQFNFNTRAFAT